MLTHSHKAVKGVEQTIYPVANIDFRRVTEGSSIELTIDSVVVEFVAGTDFAYNNSDLAATAQNYKTALDNYLTANLQTDNYTTSIDANVVNISSTRSGDQYILFPKVNDVSIITTTTEESAGGGANVQTFDISPTSNAIIAVDCYPGGVPDLFLLKVNGVVVTTTSMTSNNSDLPAFTLDDYIPSTYVYPGYTTSHRNWQQHQFIGSSKTNPETTPVTNRLTEFQNATGIKDIPQPASLEVNPHNGTAPQRIWTAANAGDTVELIVVGGTNGTGYTWKATEINTDASNDIRVTTSGAATVQTITATQIELIAESVTIENLQNYYNEAEVDGLLLNKADLVAGKVPASQLPSFVDDVLEVINYTALPVTGETGKIYITTDNNKSFRWTGSVYVEVSPMEVHTHTETNSYELTEVISSPEVKIYNSGFISLTAGETAKIKGFRAYAVNGTSVDVQLKIGGVSIGTAKTVLTTDTSETLDNAITATQRLSLEISVVSGAVDELIITYFIEKTKEV